MKAKFLLITIGAIAVSASATAADKYVAPHVKKDGTYVEGHFKTEANKTKLDNYSTKGNVNPYTGKPGTKDPYKSPYSK